MKTTILMTALIVIGFTTPVQAQDFLAHRQENQPYKMYNQIIANLTVIVLKEYLRTMR